jgi:hypothetical protein
MQKNLETAGFFILVSKVGGASYGQKVPESSLCGIEGFEVRPAGRRRPPRPSSEFGRRWSWSRMGGGSSRPREVVRVRRRRSRWWSERPASQRRRSGRSQPPCSPAAVPSSPASCEGL